MCFLSLKALKYFFDVCVYVFHWNDFLIDLCLLFQHSIDVDLLHLGWVKYTIGNTQNHKVKQINIKVISKYNEA